MFKSVTNNNITRLSQNLKWSFAYDGLVVTENGIGWFRNSNLIGRWFVQGYVFETDEIAKLRDIIGDKRLTLFVKDCDKVNLIRWLARLDCFDKVYIECKLDDKKNVQAIQTVLNRQKSLKELYITVHEKEIMSEAVDLSALSDELTILSLYNVLYKGIDRLSDMNKLKKLILVGKTDTNEKLCLSNLNKNLEYLVVRGMQLDITDCNKIFDKLTVCALPNTGVDNTFVEMLSTLVPEVNVLALGNNTNVTDVSALAKLKKLMHIEIDGTNVDSLEGLSATTSIQYISASNTLIDSVECLKNSSVVFIGNSETLTENMPNNYESPETPVLFVDYKNANEENRHKLEMFMNSKFKGIKCMGTDIYKSIENNINRTWFQPDFLYENVIALRTDMGSVGCVAITPVGELVRGYQSDLYNFDITPYLNLEILDITCRKFPYKLLLKAPEMIKHLTIDMYTYNNLSCLKNRFKDFKQLKSINFIYHPSNAEHNEEIFDILPDCLEKISVKSVFEKAPDLSRFKNLKYLELENQGMSSVDIEINLDELKKLEWISLNGFKPKFKATEPAKVKGLEVSNAQLCSIDSMFEYGVTKDCFNKLKLLKLDENFIENVESECLDLQGLEVLNMEDNIIETLPDFVKDIKMTKFDNNYIPDYVLQAEILNN